MDTNRPINYNGRTFSLQNAQIIDVTKAAGKINLDPAIYTFEGFNLLNSASFIGKNPAKNEPGDMTKTIVIIKQVLNILNKFNYKKADGQRLPENEPVITFKNISFVQDPEFSDCIRFTDLGMFNIEENVEFTNCDFYGFDDEFMYLFNCSSNGNVTFKNCNFQKVLHCINGFGNSNINISKCHFENIQHDCNLFTSDCTYKFEKCTAVIYNGTFITALGNSKGSVEQCKINGIFVEKPGEEPSGNQLTEEDIEKLKEQQEKSVKRLYEGQELLEKMAETQQAMDGIESGIKARVNIYKTTFHNVYQGFTCGDNSVIKAIECRFTDNVQDIGVVDHGDVSINSCSFTGGDETAVFGTDNAAIAIYDSQFKKLGASGIYLTEKAQLKMYDSKLLNNKGHGIINSEKSSINIHHCEFINNMGSGVYSDGESSGSVSGCTIQDNKMFNILLFGNSDMSFENNNIFFTKPTVFDFQISNVACHENGKGYFINNRFSGYKKTNGCFYVKDNGNIYIKDSSFNFLDFVAVLEGKSKVYVKDSSFENMGQNIAMGEKDSVCSFVGCDGVAPHKSTINE